MKRNPVVIAAIAVVFLILTACQTETALTGIRIRNNTGYQITEVYIVPDGFSFDGASNLLSGTIADGDFREFETIAGDFDVMVEIAYEIYETNPEMAVVENAVTSWTVVMPDF